MNRLELEQKLKDFDDADILSAEEINNISKMLLNEDISRQRYICIEETAELIQEITKAKRNKLNKLGLSEEIADMLLCINNIYVLFIHNIPFYDIKLDPYEILFETNNITNGKRCYEVSDIKSLSDMIELFDFTIYKDHSSLCGDDIFKICNCIYNIDKIINMYGIDRMDILRIIAIKIKRFNDGHR